ncbi:EF2563 family selenium-dependent molybdenum hydroxylase system protein [Treponema phagedenis]|uniref:EF2563 family selenium-dependent molybdenum hydroxylase system protein n=1 Tax=Treponema phagedenis TaxID=162 RepID=A0A0B7GW19_TREPH|nr:selenium-dependent molybdenum cofactor biosynthesis protein YqeB [Treponema phagedenis]EFW37472.1 selenium-dependent molybdenum hydroxylase system protein, YqeB family [Treponema phagedenis F0421]NVP24770.1 EF2563 family selenium-dependent molybdenum hydroxylase system protein [Treponema phagedenis]QEJ95881.1 EF2563 family selenium-dependent molybdenum hydroxylase system protein [Treponema phagedenis]QEJ98885.1 EF2563 family selenium-dependent molybdenum hydroxylase system protein [Treponema
MDEVIAVRGAGDIATGVIQKLHRSGFKVLALECKTPSAIRRSVALCEAVYEGTATVEDIEAVLCKTISDIHDAWKKNKVAIIVDENCETLKRIKVDFMVDAILAKKNLGTGMQMAKGVVALGPGFTAGKDCHIGIETNRGHNLGRLIFSGGAEKNTGIPGAIMGFSAERVIHSPAEGVITNLKNIGDIVHTDEVIAVVDDYEIKAKIAGVLRGLIKNEYKVFKGMKIADVDPREKTDCNTISDKARAIGGAVLEAIMVLKIKNNAAS